MKKQILLILLSCFTSMLTFVTHAQIQTHPITLQTVVGPIITTIQEIQYKDSTKLATCDDVSPFVNLTVRVRGRMVMGGKTTFPAFTDAKGVSYPQTTTSTAVNQFGRDLVMQAGNGPFSGIILRSGNCGAPLTGIDPLDLIAGDSVEVEGVLEDNTGAGFGGNTQINPSKFTLIDVETANKPPLINGQQIEGIAPILVKVGDLNTGGSAIINNLVTGEQYENMFVEIKDLTVVEYSSGNNTITEPDYNSPSQRVRVICRDNEGNYIQIYDRFKAGRLPKNVQTSGTCGGTVSQGGTLGKIPPIGGKYNSVKGILVNIKNQVPGQTCANVALQSGLPANDKGYQLEPFFPTHYDIAPYTPPVISDLNVTPSAPATNQDAVVSATIQTVDPGITIAGAKLYFSFDTLNPLSWSSVDMSPQGSTWSGSVPSFGFTEGKVVYFYVKASDNRTPSLDTYFPAIPATVNGVSIGKEKPSFFVVRDNGLQIRDIQSTPFSNGISGYNNRFVTVTGVATSTVNDLGRVTIQQEGVTEWGAIFLENNSFLSDVKRGDKITVKGKVTEVRAGTSTFTVLTNLDLSAKIQPIATGIRINPIFISPSVLEGNYSFRKHEKYEAILATIYNPNSGGKLYVVDTSADYNANFSEYKIGLDSGVTIPTTVVGLARNVLPGTRILAGREPSDNTISSQKFPLILNPVSLSGGYFPPQVDIIAANKIKTIYVSKNISFDNITGIIQHSFGPTGGTGVMKLLPRDLFDIKGLKSNGEDVVMTLPGFTLPTTVTTNTIKATIEESDIYVYPNPSSGVLNIKLMSKTQVSATLFSLLGSQVIASKVFDTDETIDLSGLSKGIYILKIASTKTGDSVIKRIVLE